MLTIDNPKADEVDKALDEPLPTELTPQQRELQEARRQADRNRQAVAVLTRPGATRVSGR